MLKALSFRKVYYEKIYIDTFPAIFVWINRLKFLYYSRVKTSRTNTCSFKAIYIVLEVTKNKASRENCRKIRRKIKNKWKRNRRYADFKDELGQNAK